MDSLDKIYLQWYDDDGYDKNSDDYIYDEEVTWCEDKINDTDIEYTLTDIVKIQINTAVAEAMELNKILVNTLDNKYKKLLDENNRLKAINESLNEQANKWCIKTGKAKKLKGDVVGVVDKYIKNLEKGYFSLGNNSMESLIIKNQISKLKQLLKQVEGLL